MLARPPLRAEESSTRPSWYDAVAAAPNNHRVVVENEKVRVFEVTINPGEKEPFHEHPLFSVMNIITGAPLRITPGTLQDGQIVTGKRLKLARTISSSVALDASSKPALSGERRDGGLSRVSHRAERGRKIQRHEAVKIVSTCPNRPERKG